MHNMAQFYRIVITNKKEITLELFTRFKVISIQDDTRGFTNIIIKRRTGHNIPKIIMELLDIGIRSIELVWELDTKYKYSDSIYSESKYFSNKLNNVLDYISCKELVDYKNDKFYKIYRKK